MYGAGPLYHPGTVSHVSVVQLSKIVDHSSLSCNGWSPCHILENTRYFLASTACGLSHEKRWFTDLYTTNSRQGERKASEKVGAHHTCRLLVANNFSPMEPMRTGPNFIYSRICFGNFVSRIL